MRPRVWTGLLLNESYRVGPLIEQGAATELYDGTEDSTGEPVALKILLPQLAEDARTRALFLDEARALRRLSQPGLLRYRACARDPQSDLTYIVTDLVGMRLSSRLANRKLGEQDIVDLTRRLALALAAAHGAGVIHRGLRPHAIALPQGRLSDATITDFNLIKAAHSGLGDAFVDPDYGAPEQLSNSGESAVVGPWTDVYSLALVIFSALGKPSEGPRKASPDLSHLPGRLRPVFERMLEPKAARRLQTMDEVVKQLDIALGSAPLQALLNRAQAIRLPSFRFAAARETATPARRPVVPAMAARTSPAPLPDSLQPAKTVPLGKFHGPRAAMGFGGMARRGAAALSALLLAATPWIVQTSFPRGPADASTVPPSAQVQTASKARTPAALPKGQVYGADNANSRVSLRVHRPTRVVVHSRGNRLLFSRALQPGDLYRAPSLPDLRVSADDGGAVEVVLNGVSAGFVGPNGGAVQQARLSQFASVAPPRPAPTASVPAKAPVEPTRTETQAIIGEVEVTPPQAVASTQPAEPPAAVPEVVATEDLPEPPAAVAISPAAPAPLVQAASEPAPPEPEARRPLLQRLLPWRANRTAAPAVEGTTATAVILAPSITKEAADRAKAAADMARAARLEAQRKAVEANRGRREGAFFNSTLGINSPY